MLHWAEGSVWLWGWAGGAVAGGLLGRRVPGRWGQRITKINEDRETGVTQKRQIERIGLGSKGRPRREGGRGGIDSTWERPACTKHKPKSEDHHTRRTLGRAGKKSNTSQGSRRLASCLLSFSRLCVRMQATRPLFYPRTSNDRLRVARSALSPSPATASRAIV